MNYNSLTNTKFQFISMMFGIAFGTLFLIKLSYAIGFSNHLVVSIWPSAGLNYWAARKFGFKSTYPIFIGNIIGHYSANVPNLILYGIPLVNAISYWIGILCEQYFTKRNIKDTSHPFHKLTSTTACFIAGFGGLSLFASIFGSLIIIISFNIPLNEIPTLFFRWFLSDFTGCMILAPLLLTIQKLTFDRKSISTYLIEITIVTIPLVMIYLFSYIPGVSKLITFSFTIFTVLPIVLWIACRDNTPRMTFYFTIISFGVFLISINSSTDLNDMMWLSTQLAITFILVMGYILHARHSEYNFLLSSLESQVEERTEKLQATISELEEKNNEIAQSSKELKDSLFKLQNTQSKLVETEKQASLGRLVAGIAHEINTPLGVSITYVSFALEQYHKLYDDYQKGLFKKSNFEKFCSQLEDALTGTTQNLNRTSELVKTFKMISTSQTSQVTREIDLHEYFVTGLDSLSHYFKGTNIKYNLKKEKEIVVKTDPSIIFQILTNIVMNSLHHAFKDDNEGLIEITLDRDETNVMMIFSDNGSGMNDDQLAHIFDPFYTTARNSGGTGLGSHIVYNLVTQALHGTITCKSALGEGTLFTIKIPLV